MGAITDLITGNGGVAELSDGVFLVTNSINLKSGFRIKNSL